MEHLGSWNYLTSKYEFYNAVKLHEYLPLTFPTLKTGIVKGTHMVVLPIKNTSLANIYINKLYRVDIDVQSDGKDSTKSPYMPYPNSLIFSILHSTFITINEQLLIPYC